MTELDPKAWEDTYSGRERIRMVVETLDEPATVSDIAESANVAWGTADSELTNLQTKKKVKEHTTDGKTKYGPNPVQILVEEILDLISENTRAELESTLITYKSQIESLQDEYDVKTQSELRDEFVRDDRSTEQLREIRDVVSTWETLEAEISLTKHALQLYEDVSRLSDSTDDNHPVTA
ncbi:DUF7342 family protein [Natronocalculus amylovorans]|uniref:ArsR family transcriptional regulator n=1 Tax=Natronocalculus amylovorans TaxID=2917812 RepID=A0AAE3K981_9EURY|nr:ArsR family transcriptional regulator [Natronocalculus amylovorans]MCL9817798.1 ArsR family transcriptional regulator [Natronocalculus amylovorans]